jgi:hypothetical protein
MIIELHTVVDDHAPYGPTVEDCARGLTDGYDVTWQVVDLASAGGNPTIRFEGSEQELKAMVHAMYDIDTYRATFTEESV